MDQRTDKEQYTRSNAVTTRPLTLVRLVETLARDSLNTSKRQEMVSDVYNHIAEHHVQTKPQLDCPCPFVTCIKYSIDYYQQHFRKLVY